MNFDCLLIAKICFLFRKVRQGQFHVCLRGAAIEVFQPTLGTGRGIGAMNGLASIHASEIWRCRLVTAGVRSPVTSNDENGDRRCWRMILVRKTGDGTTYRNIPCVFVDVFYLKEIPFWVKWANGNKPSFSFSRNAPMIFPLNACIIMNTGQRYHGHAVFHRSSHRLPQENLTSLTNKFSHATKPLQSVTTLSTRADLQC